MPGQTTYIQSFVKAFAGMLADCGQFFQRITSKTVVSTSTGIPAGVFVCRSGADDVCDVPALTASVTGPNGFGITMLEVAQEPHNGVGSLDGGVLNFNPLQQVNVVEKGVIWAVPEAGGTTYGSGVFARFTANGAGKLQLGALRLDVDGGNAVAIPGAKWLDTTASGPARVLLA